jgi:hypothetical protein
MILMFRNLKNQHKLDNKVDLSIFCSEAFSVQSRGGEICSNITLVCPSRLLR